MYGIVLVFWNTAARQVKPCHQPTFCPFYSIIMCSAGCISTSVWLHFHKWTYLNRCRPVRQRQSVKDVSEEVTHTGRSPGRPKGFGCRHYAASGRRSLIGSLAPSQPSPALGADLSRGPVLTQTVPISASGLRGSEPLVDRLM